MVSTMASILTFVPGHGRPVPPGHEAAILFFPGIRYERPERDREESTDGPAQNGLQSTPRR